MNISKDIIIHVAALARLKLSEDEIDRLKIDMENIINHVNKLNELDISNVEPTAHIMSIKNVLREDVVEESINREELLKNAPSKEDGCFKVPKIVE